MNAQYTYVQVEPNDNCPMSASQVYKNLGSPFAVKAVRIYEGQPEGTLYDICGWYSLMNGISTLAYAVQVEDSSEGAAYLVYGGDWGLRLRPIDSAGEWSLSDSDQFGETHLVLSELSDLIPG